MPAYVIAQIEVTDTKAFEDYRRRVPDTIAKYGGEYVVRGGALEVLEGNWAHPRCVIIRFPSMERARAWYESPDYAGPKALRRSASRGNLVLVEGV